MKIFTSSMLATLACVGLTSVAQAQVQPGIFGPEETSSKAAFAIPYLRLGLGGEQTSFEDAYWDPPGDDDPRVYYDLPDEKAAMGSIALGYDWGKGLRGEIALMGFGEKDVAGDWSYTVPDTTGPHASMAGTVKSTALMANAYLAPMERQGNTGAFQPFLMAGIGIASNDMADWTRTNADSENEFRSFQGAVNRDVAWTVGLGAAWQIGGRGQKPVMLELMYQYIDLGRAQGGSTPLPGSEVSEPREPWGFDLTANVVSVGIRIPIK